MALIKIVSLYVFV